MSPPVNVSNDGSFLIGLFWWLSKLLCMEHLSKSVWDATLFKTYKWASRFSGFLPLSEALSFSQPQQQSKCQPLCCLVPRARRRYDACTHNGLCYKSRPLPLPARLRKLKYFIMDKNGKNYSLNDDGGGSVGTYNESWVSKNWCFSTVVLREDSWEDLRQ